jgi:hypothetical protein
LPDRRKTKSKYTLDRRIPGAFEGETVTRRRFMTGTANVAGAVAAGAFTLPAIGFAAGPIFEEHEQPWQDIGDVGEFPNDSYIPKVISVAQGIGEAGNSTVYVRAGNPRSTWSPRTSTTRSSSSRRAACTWAARSATSPRPSASSARATAGSTTSAASSTAGRRSARSTASTPACATAASRSARATPSTASCAASPRGTR